MSRNTDHALAEVQQICSLGLPIGSTAPDLAASLQQLVPSKHVVFTLPDRIGRPGRFLFPTCTLTNESKLDVFADTTNYLALERTLDTSFDRILHHGRPTRSSSEYGRRLINTPMYDRILHPLGLERWVRTAVRGTDHGLGILFFSRPEGEPDYTHREVERIESIHSFLAHALAVADGKFVDDWRAGDDEGLAVVDSRGQVLHLCPTGQLLRRMIAFPGGVGGPDHTAVWNGALQELARRMQSIRDGAPSKGPPAWQHCNPWGRYELRAQPLLPRVPSEQLMAVRIRRFRPAEVRLARALSSLGLTPRERDVAMFVVQGEPNASIATRLALRPNTIAGIIKDIYRKANVASREELLERVLRQPAIRKNGVANSDGSFASLG